MKNQEAEENLKRIADRMPEMYIRTAKDLPVTVHCPECGNEQSVKPAHYLQYGWPKCCGGTMRLGDKPKPIPVACPGGCTHTDDEHRAFDEGLAAGEAGIEFQACPYEDFGLREDWLTGHSVGVLNRDDMEEL